MRNVLGVLGVALNDRQNLAADTVERDLIEAWLHQRLTQQIDRLISVLAQHLG